MKKILLSITLLAALSALYFYAPSSPMLIKTTQDIQQPSALDLINETGIIRCGYWIYEPFISKDPNTGKMSGLTVDYLEKTAERMGKKIVWEMEAGYDQIRPALDYKRFDVFCVPCSPNEDFRKQFDFVGSFGKMPYYIYTTKDNEITREQLKEARFAVTDGYLTSLKTPEYFPSAKIISLPQMASSADVYNQLRYGKVDVIVNEHISALNYMRNNPNTIKQLEDTPLFTTTMYFPISKGDTRLGDFIHKMTDTTVPENKEIFLNLLKEYGLGTNALRPH